MAARVMALLLVLQMAASPLPSAAQERPYDKTKAVPEDQSSAEKVAEQMVALSPDKIVSILTDEPGLILLCKRLLVKAAYEQGRLLDPEDLTDDALFRLIRSDHNIQVLFTREIESRAYVRAKPSKEELERQWRMRAHVTQTAQAGGPPSAVESELAKRVRNQEDAYWLQHQRDMEQAQPPFTGPDQGYPGSPSSPAQPENPQQNAPPVGNQRRNVLTAQSQMPENYGSENESAGLQRVSPDQLPGLLDSSLMSSLANGEGGYTAGAQRQGANPMGMPSQEAGQGGISPAYPGYAGTTAGTGVTFGQQYPQQARLETRERNAPTAPGWERQTQPALRHRPNPYADVPSLYDLNQQYSRRSPVLERFGADVFQNGTGNSNNLPMDMPVGPDYVVGPGDGLSIDLSGSISQRLQRSVDREGRVSLPEAGVVQVSGKSLGEVQRLVQNALRTQFRDVQADISLSRLRTVRVYVVGDVERPGAYDVSSLSTPLNAVYEAGGPTSRGSLRILKHYRGKQLVQQVDVYDLLLHGVRSGMERLEAGDTVLVAPLSAQITVEGMVRRPAIYELNGETTLAEILELAGGVLPSGTLRHVDVERVEAHQSRTMLRLDLPENNNQEAANKALDEFKIQDGDKVQISPILPYAERTVYLEGHVFHPGKFAYREGMKVTDLIGSAKDLLPEPYLVHAEIIRLKQPDNSPEVLAFNLGDALQDKGKEQDIALQPFDTLRVYARYDFEDAPVITVNGAVRDPGDHVTNGATYLRDAVYLAGNVTSDAQTDDAQVFRKNQDGTLKVFSVNLKNALAGDPKDNLLLLPKDRVFIHKSLAKVDPATVTIEGEVGRPGRYPLGDGMTVAELVQFAGGLKRSAYTQEADLTRYAVEQGSKILGERQTVLLAKALSGEPDTDLRMHDGDVLTIRQLSGWKDVGATITVTGEVLHPGTYGIQSGERLSSVIQRAGGFRSDAYPYGSVFQRVQVRELEERNRADLIQRVKNESAEMKFTEKTDPQEKLAQTAALNQYQATLDKLQNTPPAGRMVVHVSNKMEHWANTSADVEVRAGDSIYVPKKPNVVMVDGSVYNPTAITYKPGRNVGWYLKQSGGPSGAANQKGIFVIRADGSVVGGSGGMFSGGVQSAAVQPGDMVIVPEKIYTANSKWKTTLEIAQLATAVGIAIQVARSF